MNQELELGIYNVLYTAEDGYLETFRCTAEDAEHATEQFHSAYPALMVEEVEYKGLA